MKKISIVVPIYNVELYLRECIESLVNQNLPSAEYEIILVNDGSTDRSGEIAKEYVDKFDNITFYEQVNQGQAVARNLGLNKAQGEYVMFVDSDDYLEKNILKRMYDEAVANNNDILITGFNVQQKDGDYHNQTDLKIFNTNLSGADALLQGLNIGSTCTRLYKRELLSNNNIYFKAGIKHEDVYFNIEVYPLAKSIRSLDLYTYNYRWNEGSTDRSFDRVNITKGLMSDLEIARLARETSVAYRNTNKELSAYFLRMSNSLLVSNILAFTTRRVSSERDAYISKAKTYGLYPVNGPTNSWKSTLLSKVLNIFIH